MKKKLFFLLSVSTLLLSFCTMPAPSPNGTATPFIPAPIDTATVTVEIPTTTFTPTVAPIPEPSQTPSAAAQQQFIAYAQNEQLAVTDVTGGVQGGTTQYTLAGESDKVMDIVWSPSGEFVAFTSYAKPDPHVFYIYALGDSSPTDLGPGSAPTWSPDSKSVAYVGGTYPNNNIWVTTIDNPAPRQLSFESNHAWGKPAFTPDGQSLVVTTADRMNMGAQGNTSFTLESLALDGSGTHTPLPGAGSLDGVRLPYDLQFSPDGQKLSFSTSYHLSACASPGAYYVANPDGSNLQAFISPSLRSAVDENKQIYAVGFTYAWVPASDALVIFGDVVNCDFSSPDSGKSVAGPQMSIVGLDGTERLVIPGFFWGVSMDRTGTWIAASHLKDFQDQQPTVDIYSAQTGQLALSLGMGRYPVFQP
jgi:hypothetical protein